MAADILEKIAADRRIQVAEEKKEISLEEMKKKAYAHQSVLPEFSFEKALRKQGMSFICEVKKASPSKGLIAKDFPYVDIAKAYEAAGADCISVLTEPKYFLGSDQYLEEIRKNVRIPILRKDFVVDIYQIYQAKQMGADAVLLICALSEESFLKECITITKELGLTALVEAHDRTEIEMAIRCGATVIGVNNRNLRDFSIDMVNSSRLRQYAPENTVFVAESGIREREDVLNFEKQMVNAVLVGETLMRAEDKKQMLDYLRGNESL